MSDCPDENAWSALGEGGVGDDAREALERHLDGCERCSRLVAELAWLATADASVPDGEGPTERARPDRYRIVRQLGQGAMGIVWEAEDTQLGRRVALKWVRPEVSADAVAGAAARPWAGASPPALARARLWREARALAQLRHPNVLTVHDVGEVDGEVFLALELVRGKNARAWRAAAERTPTEVLAVWCAAAAGLAAVHRAGLVHRDIKPDNVLVADDGRVLVGDFGLAKGDAGLGIGAEVDVGMTATGQLVGTPSYMAPELLRGDAATPQSDQFAWCLAAWEALTGARPFQGASVAALAVAMTRAPAIPAGSERRLMRILARGLDPVPSRRWPDMGALVEALARPDLRRRASVVAVLSLGGALAAAGLLLGLTAGVGEDVPRAGGGDVVWAGAPGNARAAEPEALALASVPEVAPTRTILDATVLAAATDAHVAAREVTARGDAPVPVLPRAAVIPVTPAEWRARYDDATDRLGAGDARGCLALLAGIPPVPPDVHVDIEALRATCMMASGDCAGGRTELARVGRTHGWAADKIAREVDLTDTRSCPIDAPPATRWPARALHRLQLATSAKRSCAPVLATIARLQVAMPETSEYAWLRVNCAVNGGDCVGARALFVARMSAAQPEGSDERTKAEAYANGQFVKVYPSCAGR